jgi:hypothetical protein
MASKVVPTLIWFSMQPLVELQVRWDIIMDFNNELLLTHVPGGSSFAASFGPGRYRAFACVDFKGDGFELVSIKWLSDFCS